MKLRIASSEPSAIECVLSGRGVRADVVAQASTRAWAEYDTTIVHQVQAYGSGAVHEPGQLPQPVRGVGTRNAAWIPARRELVATNGTQSRGGTYVAVEITRSTARGSVSRLSLTLARAVARAALETAPRGPTD